MLRLLPLSLLIACGGGVTAEPSTPTDEDGDGVVLEEDCDDNDAAVYPGAAEICNGIDDDCDGAVDEQDDDLTDGLALFADKDGDGYGDPEDTVIACAPEDGAVEDATDCDDSDAAIHPGAPESCDTMTDDNCDGSSNDVDAEGCHTLYPDADGDGFGGPEGACVCQPDDDWPAFYPDDCDDTDATINPDAAEVCDDGVDNDCDGAGTGCVWAGDTSLDDADASVLGDTAGDGAGEVLLAPGDLDGDGAGDLVVLARDGEVAALFTTPLAGTQSMSDGAAVVTGVRHVALGGDLDGDGQQDLLVGNEQSMGGAGAVWLWSSPSGSVSTGDLGEPLVGGVGAGAGLPQGFGDIDGDGVADLAVSAPTDSEVFLLRGPITGGGALDDVGQKLRGTAPVEAMVALGDTNGDGLADLGMGAPESGAGGVVWTLLGPATDAFLLSEADGVIDAPEADSHFGAALAAADLNGDGYGDLLVGAPYTMGDFRETGAAYLVLGPLTGAPTPMATFVGENATDYAGISVAAGGDLDGDGAPDLAMGANENGQIATRAGLTYVMYGPVTGGDYELKFADAFFEARERDEHSASAIGIGSDFDADGIDDVAIGAPGYDGAGEDAGSVELLLGRGM